MDQHSEEGGVWKGLSLFWAVAFIVWCFAIPLSPPPQKWFPLMVPVPISFGKALVVRYVGAVILIAGAVALLGPLARRLSAVRLPLMLLLAYVTCSTASAFASGDRVYSLHSVVTPTVLCLAAALAPMFLTSERRLHLLLAGLLASAVIAGSIGALGGRFPILLEYIHGGDILKNLMEGSRTLEGGISRGMAMSTLGNPEYMGMFAAGGFVLAGCWLLDGWGTQATRKLQWWVAGVCIILALAAGVVASGTRGAFVVIFAGVVARWLLRVPLRGWIIALGLFAVVAMVFLVSALAGMAIFALCSAGAFAVQWRSGALATVWSQIDLRNRIAIASGPLLAVLVFVAFSIPGPWNPRGLRLANSFAIAFSVTDFSVQTRLMFYMISGEIVSQDPLLGAGPGFFGPLFHEELYRLGEKDETGVIEYARTSLGSSLAEHAHNDYFQIAAEQGLAGLALFLSLMAALLVRLGRVARSEDTPIAGIAAALVATICGYMTMMLSSFPLHETARLSTFYALVAAALATLSVANDRSATIDREPGEAKDDAPQEHAAT